MVEILPKKSVTHLIISDEMPFKFIYFVNVILHPFFLFLWSEILSEILITA